MSSSSQSELRDGDSVPEGEESLENEKLLPAEDAETPQQSWYSFNTRMKTILCAILCFCIIAAASAAAIVGGAASKLDGETVPTQSPTSYVKGKVFDRFVIIWLENTDYSMAAGDPSLASLAQKGVQLENYFGVTHPSEPNYCASFGGDYFGMDNDNLNRIPSNVSSVVDLLDAKGISWGAYQEDLPYTGFEGNAWTNQQTGANDYVRKHNPPIIYDSVATNVTRRSQVKSLTSFQDDLAANKLPQWMFITPNMVNDGHDSDVTTAGSWTKNFLEPLLNNKNFMNNTLVLVTFDENHTYSEENRVLSILLGDAVSPQLVGTKDPNFYNHYSELSTVEANWGLDTLGRFDAGANVFSMIADVTADTLRSWDDATSSTPTRYFNASYAGLFNSDNTKVPFPAPNLTMEVNGRKVFPAIQSLWSSADFTYYNDGIEIPDGMYPPNGF